MKPWIIDGMIYIGSALMVYNIWGFMRFSRRIRQRDEWKEDERILNIPIILLLLFLVGYLVVGFFGKPDLVMAGILFGGSVFVYIMYRMLDQITGIVIEQEKLKAEIQAAAESSRSKAEFLASISHEMRTPLNVIMGLDALALKNPKLPPETREQLEKIGRSGENLLEIINNILDMNSIEKGDLTVRDEPFAMADVLRQVNAVLSTRCEEKGLRYESRADDEAGGVYRGDEILLRQILLGVLDNAVKYTDAPGTVSLKTGCLSSDAETRRIWFTVEDSGIGIDEDFLPKIFEPFAREDASSTSRIGGSGLGLPAVKKKVELLGGEILAESEKGRGATFTITLPLRVLREPERETDAAQKDASTALPAEPAIPDEAENAAAEEQDGEESGLLEGCRILIAEDIPENAEIVRDLLELEGAETEHAENGKLALELFRQREPYYYDAILMDLRMPVMDGLEATRQIRALDREDAGRIPILALTANSFPSDVQQSLEAGMNAHLSKPTDADALYGALRSQIEKERIKRGGEST